MFVEPDRDPGVEILHGSVEILLGCGGDDVVMIRHEDDVVDKKVIFFMGFLECLEHDAGNVPLVESECPVIGPAHEMVG